jgi:hypothetical protein
MADDPITSTSTTNHLYDDPTLGSLEFLLAVMHSPEVDLIHRIAAADALLPYVKAKPQPTVRPWYVNGIPTDTDCTIAIRIGGMPDQVH